MNNKFEAAYILGQQAAMEKVAYSPSYSKTDIDAIRRYNRDVSSGTGQASGVLGAGLGVSGMAAYGGLALQQSAC